MRTAGCFASGILLASAVGLVGCSSSSSDSSGSAGSGSGGTGTSGSPELNNLEDVEGLIDPSNFDYSAETGSASLTRGLLGRSESTFSRAACEAYTLKRQLFSDAQEIESFICYVSTLDAAKEELSIPEGSYNYYQIEFPKLEEEEDGPPPTVRIRVGKLDGELRMDACVPRGDEEEYAQEIEFHFSASSTGYSGFVVKNFAEHGYSGGGRIDVNITGTSAEDYSDASFVAYHRDEDGEDHGWTSYMDFLADSATHTNTLSGANQNNSSEWGSHQGQIVGQWGSDLAGSVKFAVGGEYPAPDADRCREWGVPEEFLEFCVDQCGGPESTEAVDGFCTFENSALESFQIDNSTTPPSFSKTAEDDSPYYAYVDSQSLPELDSVEEHLAFTTDGAWDCTASSGSEFVVVDATDLEALRGCEPEREEDIWRLCEEQQQIAEQSDGPGEQGPEEQGE